ncbi:MAG: D-aminoacyl-tRNA deacylase [Sphaerochaetaceae bacterium]|jgi:D-tyrosyl-tRNA(Tyr) deacylase|nr:D-aminoacyl-tRNA deacylase [Sphaerochaetaceae bacterium]MDX9939992.1 D-aminoacyl-tRNA deacylase [Sphaerochaetaceae bacterium]
MRAVLQRVRDASVTVGGVTVGSIDRGLLVYLGVAKDDGVQEVEFMARKIPSMRLFTDEQDKMNLSVKDIGGKLLVVSQFTLCADLRKGNRPSFDPAAQPEMANELYERFVGHLRAQGLEVQTGSFGASMQVQYTNEGPITIVLDSPPR